MRLLLSLALLASLSSATLAGPNEDAYSAIEQWAKAFNEGTADDMAATYSPGATMWGTMAIGLASREGMKRSFTPGAGVAKVKLGEHVSQQLSDTVVVDAGKYDFSRTKDGETKVFPARYTFVLVKQADKWLIVHHHSSMMPKPGF